LPRRSAARCDKAVGATDGTITNSPLRVATAVENAPLIGLVELMPADLRESWKSDPPYAGLPHRLGLAHIPMARIARRSSIARGINRQQTERKLLPYVEPTTDWIRLQRRFPVTLVLQDLSPDIVLHMGADARTMIIY
jgi:multidrug efflux system membrane fusion protein